MDIVLTSAEIVELFVQPAHTEKDGGFQSLLVGMQRKTDKATGKLTLDADELERIPRYAFDYKNGGWENRLIAIFRRSLGSKLGR